MTANELREKLEPIQQKKGFYFNNDKALVDDILQQMLELKESLGYMPCPCRLASGVREQDKDIICPCAYRDADVGEFGSCYCGLYVCKDIADGKRERVAIPERRPEDKIVF